RVEPGDMQGLVAAALATHQGDTAFGHAENLGDEPDQLFVGLAVHRRRGDLDLQPVVVDTDDGIAGSLRLDMASQYQPILVDGDEGHGRRLRTRAPPSRATARRWPHG